MGKGLAFIIGAALIACGIAATGSAAKEFAVQYLTRQSESACWANSVTSTLNALATQEALPMLKASFPDDMSQKDQDTVAGSFSATVDNYGFNQSSNNGASINCSGAIAYQYTRPDGSTYSKDQGSLISYELAPSQGGWGAEMSSADIPEGIVEYVAPPPPPTPAAAPAPAPASTPSASGQPTAIPPEVADFDQGHADRAKYEAWVNSLQGPEQQGAIFWAGQRSLAAPESCANGASAAFPNDPNSQSIFQNGCQESQDTLGPLDALRKSDPLYKAGWNAPLNSPDSSASQNQ